MRSAVRISLNPRSASWLRKQTQRLISNTSLDSKAAWRSRRQTMDTNGIVEALKQMAGWRNRCMYCGDSEGCDIEHFRPKAVAEFRASVFDWINLLWICQLCNRRKGDQFPLEGNIPLLLNPTEDRVWEFFDFVEETGYLVVRSDVDAIASRRAEATLNERLTRLNHQTVLYERQRASRQLRRAVDCFVRSARSNEDEERFFVACVDAGYPELCEWYFSLSGARVEPFASLVERSPDLTSKLRVALDRLFPGVWV